MRGEPFDPELSQIEVARGLLHGFLRQLTELGRRTIAALPGR